MEQGKMENVKRKRAALYVRVSTAEQRDQGLSVDSQIDALRKFCEDNGYDVAGIYNDAGISARKKFTKRPALLRLCSDCENGMIDIILFTKLDRWFRSVADYYQVQTILDNAKVPWRAIWEDYETETSAGVFKVNIMLSVAQAEADRTSERIRAVNDFKRARGDYLGSAPVGYLVRGRNLIVDEEKKDAVKAMFDTYLLTWSARKAVDVAAEHGLKIEREYFHKIIKREAYCGNANGYKCYAYITPEQHDQIIERTKAKTRTPIEHRVFLFSGLVRCGYCGQRMPAKAVKRHLASGEEVVYNKYICLGSLGTKRDCPPLNYSEAILENVLLTSLDTIMNDKKVIAETRSDDDVAKNIARISKLKGKLGRLSELYLDGDIDREEYRKRKEDINKEIDSIKIVPMSAPKELPENWKEIYMDLSKEDKKSFWQSIIRSITVTNSTKLTPQIEFL